MKAAMIILVISVFANLALGLGYLGQRDALTRARENLKTSQDAAEACSNGVTALEKLAASRKKDADKARAAAKVAAQYRDQRADVILSTPATVPGNDCKSASDRAGAWLAGRAGS